MQEHSNLERALSALTGELTKLSKEATEHVDTILAAQAIKGRLVQCASDAETRVRELTHSDSLIRDALKAFATDCSTPTFQLARNAAERIAELERKLAESCPTGGRRGSP